MNLSPDIKVFLGSEKQRSVGIMGRAVIYLNAGSETVAYFNQITVRQSKEGKWWIQWPAQEDSRGTLNERGYVKTYPYYRMFPGEENKNRRIELEQLIIKKTEELMTTGGGQAQQQTQQAPPQGGGVAAPPPPAAAAATAASAQDGLSWDLGS